MVQMPYLTLAGIVICIGIAIALVRLPRISHDRASAGPLPGLRSVLREPALAGAVIAQFFYVGAQVGVWSFFIDFVKELSPATPERTAAFLLSLSLVLFLAGRCLVTPLMRPGSARRLLLACSPLDIRLIGKTGRAAEGKVGCRTGRVLGGQFTET